MVDQVHLFVENYTQKRPDVGEEDKKTILNVCARMFNTQDDAKKDSNAKGG